MSASYSSELCRPRKKQGLTVTAFDKDESPDKQRLLEAFAQSGDVMARYIQHGVEQGGKVSNFKRGVVPMLGYYISHESHHRGHLLLTLRQCGHRLPDTLRRDMLYCYAVSDQPFEDLVLQTLRARGVLE